MAEQKTKPTKVSVRAFLNRIPQAQRRKDALELLKVMQQITGAPPKMWGPTIVGFGQYHYRYPSGHEGDACLAAFSPRKPDFVLYLAPGLLAKTGLLKTLGKHKASKGCLYVRRLEDIHMPTLKILIRSSVAHVKKLYG
jgi:hypothetical protein